MSNRRVITICRWWGEWEYQTEQLPLANHYQNLYKSEVDRSLAIHLFNLGQPVYLNNKLRLVKA